MTGIQKLVLAGRVGEAIQVTQQLYPGLLEHNPNLLFLLKLVNIIFKTSITNAVVLPQTFIHSAESLAVSGVAVAITGLFASAPPGVVSLWRW